MLSTHTIPVSTHANPYPASSVNPQPTAIGGTGNGKTTSGTVSSQTNGDGTFSKAMEEVNGQKTVDKTVTYANGKTKSTERTVTVNQDGSKTITKVGNNGKTSTIQETSVTNSDGSTTTSKEKTGPNGTVTDTTATMTKSLDGTKDCEVTRTNAENQTETFDRQIAHSNGSKTVTTTGTGYSGNSINNEITWTTVA
jgi:hypothetical protein